MTGTTPPPAPTREEVRAKLFGLLDGSVTREEAHDWAVQWIGARDPEVDDEVVWQGLTTIILADAHGGDRPYLYGDEDFGAWLAEFEAASLPRQ